VNGNFEPPMTLTRLELAVALVRALGQDAQARALAGTPSPSRCQREHRVIATWRIFRGQRGYAQIALKRVSYGRVPQPDTVQFGRRQPQSRAVRCGHQ